jgi:WhiB family transcriptional regulator, redox-sensing transcriptional regulator
VSGNWLHRAACRGAVDPDLFFPEGTTGPAQHQTDKAKAVCATCEVRPECLAWAVTMGERTGVWGGLDPDERAALSGRAGDGP